MNLQALLIAGLVGLLLQLAMVYAGHRNAFLREFVFAIGGTTISLAAGMIYGKLGGEPWVATLLGGALAGGAGAFAGVLISFLLKEAPATLLVYGALASALTGALGAALGRLLV